MRLIDADALAKELMHEGLGYQYNRVINAPTVDAVPVRHGYWIRKEWAEESEGLLIDNYECSACNSWVRNETNYCPNCGAKMDAERKEE